MKAIIFDIGGVVLHVSKFYDKLTERYGETPDSFIGKTRHSFLLCQKGKIRYEEYWQRAAKKIPLIKQEDIRRVTTEVNKTHKNDRLNKDVVKLIQALHKKYRLACLTNTIDEHYSHNEEKGVYRLFDVVVASNKVGMAKPYRNIYRHTLKLLKVKPEEAVFIDDRPEYVKPAKELGMKGIRFKNASQLQQDLSKIGVM